MSMDRKRERSFALWMTPAGDLLTPAVTNGTTADL